MPGRSRGEWRGAKGKQKTRPECVGKPWVIPLLSLLPQYFAHRKEGEVPQFSVHGLVGDPVPRPQTSCRSDTRQPRECAHFLLPVMPRWRSCPKLEVGWGQNLMLSSWRHRLLVLLHSEVSHLVVPLQKMICFQTG